MGAWLKRFARSIGQVAQRRASLDLELDDRWFVKETLLTSDHQDIWEETVSNHQCKMGGAHWQVEDYGAGKRATGRKCPV